MRDSDFFESKQRYHQRSFEQRRKHLSACVKTEFLFGLQQSQYQFTEAVHPVQRQGQGREWCDEINERYRTGFFNNTI